MGTAKLSVIGTVGALLLGMVASASAQSFHTVEEATMSLAKAWQSGEKARALMSADGKILFPFGQTMPTLTCAPMRACDLEMEAGELPSTVTVGDKVNWAWAAAESTEKGKPIQHIIFQPKDKDVETNAIITTDRRTYHLILRSSTQGGYLNRAGFYYPEDLVVRWTGKAAADDALAKKDKDLHVTPVAVAPQKLAFDYNIENPEEVDFAPLRVFNDGERVYMEMPSSLSTGEHPVLMLMNEAGKASVVNYRREVDETTGTIHYVVDKLFANAELHRGTESVKIAWRRKQIKSGTFTFGSITGTKSKKPNSYE